MIPSFNWSGAEWMRSVQAALVFLLLLLPSMGRSQVQTASASRDAVYGVGWDLDDGATTVQGECIYCDEGDVFSGVQAPFDHLLYKVRATARSAKVAEALRGRRSLIEGWVFRSVRSCVGDRDSGAARGDALPRDSMSLD